MSLLNDSMIDCTVLDAKTVSDGVSGGTITVYTEGAKIKAAITLDISTQARIADAQGVKNLYTVTTRKAVNLPFRTIIRRDEDGKIFRITSDGDDKKTPKSAKLDMRVMSAEEFDIKK